MDFPPWPILNGVESSPLKAVRGCFVLQAPPCADVMHPGCVFLMSVLRRVLARRRGSCCPALLEWQGERRPKSTDVCRGRDWLMLSIGRFTLSLLLLSLKTAPCPPHPLQDQPWWEFITHTSELWSLESGCCSHSSLLCSSDQEVSSLSVSAGSLSPASPARKSHHSGGLKYKP